MYSILYNFQWYFVLCKILNNTKKSAYEVEEKILKVGKYNIYYVYIIYIGIYVVDTKFQ